MDHVQQLPHDDWHDQDLLTKKEAAERLEAEIQLIRGQLALSKVDSVEQGRLAKRLCAMEAALKEYA